MPRLPFSWTPHRVRGDPVCSFFSTARRTNQEAPPLLSGFFARRLSPPSGAAELAVLKQSLPFFLGRLASSRPDKGGVCSALSLCGLTGPRHLVILRCDAVSRNIVCGSCPLRPLSGPRIAVRGDHHVIPRYDAVSRNTGKGNTHKRPLSGPRIECGVTRAVCGIYSVALALPPSTVSHPVISALHSSMPTGVSSVPVTR